MRRADIIAIVAASALLLALALAGGPRIAFGAIAGAALAAAVFRAPIAGLGLMILAGTAFQVLGSEHLTGLPLSLGKVSGILTLAVWGLRSLAARVPLTYSPQLPWLLAFFASMAVSAQFSPDKALAMEGLFRYAQLFLLYFMIASLAGQSARSLDQSCAILSASMVLSVFIGILEFFLPSLALEDDDPGLVQGTVGAILDRDSVEGVEIKRITGGLSDSNWFAYTLAAVLPVNLYLLRRWRHAGVRLLVGAAAALQVFGIVLSLTRTAIFALAVSVAVLVLRRRLPLAPILAAAIIGGSAILAWNPPGLERLFSVQYLQEGSTPLRQQLLLGGVTLIADRPVQGYGYSEFGPAFMKWLARVPVPDSVAIWEAETGRRVADGADQLEWIMPHNSILQLWVEYGLAGIVSASLFVWAVLRDLSLCARFGGARARLLADCLAAAVWGFLVSAMFGHLAMLKIIWILAGLAAALRRVVFEGKRAVERRDDSGPAPAAAAGGTE